MSEGPTISEDEKGGVEPICLPADCGLGETTEFMDSIAAALPQKDIVIDASAVEKMSAVCALAVVSTLKYCEANSGSLAIIKPAKEFLDAFSELGLFSDMMKMEFR